MARPPGYVLQLPDAAIDAGRFELLCGQAAAASDPKVAVERLGAALAPA